MSLRSLDQQNINNNGESLLSKIMQHEDNLKFLESQANFLNESILDLQVSLARYHSASITNTENENGAFHTEEETVEQILKKENTAAGLYFWLNSNTLTQTSNFIFTKDVVGVVATLAKVDSDDHSRILSEYLGLETMLAIVCKTSKDINMLEKYDAEGKINVNGGLHGLGSSIGRKLNGPFNVICLEDLRPFVGGFVANDPQKKLDLPKPQLHNGQCPPGFLDYAVNVIHVDSEYLSFLTSSGHGLRETLFYSLFSRLQIYSTRQEMLLALPCIDDGALSLDGGMIKRCGIFVLGSRLMSQMAPRRNLVPRETQFWSIVHLEAPVRNILFSKTFVEPIDLYIWISHNDKLVFLLNMKDVEVKFPLTSRESDVPANYIEAEDLMRKLKWESSKLAADIQREQQLLDHAKANFTSHA